MNKNRWKLISFFIAVVLFVSLLPRSCADLAAIAAQQDPSTAAPDNLNIPYGEDVSNYDPEANGYYALLPTYYEIPGSTLSADGAKLMDVAYLPALIYHQHFYVSADDLASISGLTLQADASALCYSAYERKLYLQAGSRDAYYTVGDPNLYGRYYANMMFQLNSAPIKLDEKLWVPLHDICLAFDLKPHQTAVSGKDFFCIYQVQEEAIDVLADLYCNSASYLFEYSGRDINSLYASSGTVQVINGLLEGDPDAWAMFVKSSVFLDDWAMQGWEKAMTREMILDIIETGADEALELAAKSRELAADEFSLFLSAAEAGFQSIASSADIAIDLATQEWYRNSAWYDSMFRRRNTASEFANGAKELGLAMDTLNATLSYIYGVLKNWMDFEQRDTLAISGLRKIMQQKDALLYLNSNSQKTINDNLEAYNQEAIDYALSKYFRENTVAMVQDIFTSNCPAFTAYRLALHLVPGIQTTIDSTRCFQVSMYAIPFQKDIRNLLLDHLYGSNGALSSAEQQKESIELAYTYLKTCYVARNLGVSALSASKNDRSGDIRLCETILKKLAILSSSYSSSEISSVNLATIASDIFAAADAGIIALAQPMYLLIEGEVVNQSQPTKPIEDAECKIMVNQAFAGEFRGTKDGRYRIYVPVGRPDAILNAELPAMQAILSFTSPTIEGEDEIAFSFLPGEEIAPAETAYLGIQIKLAVSAAYETVTNDFFSSSIARPTVFLFGQEDIAEKITNSDAIASLYQAAVAMRDNLADNASQDNPAYSYSYDLYLQDAYATQGALSLQFMDVYYAGGVHPLSSRYYCTYDLKTGNELAISEILNPGNDSAKEELIQLFAAALRDEFSEVSDPDARIREVFEDEDTMNLWGFSKDGLRITFSPYMIAAYAVGYIDATVPYEALAGILKKNYLPQKLSSSNVGTKCIIYSRPEVRELYDNFENLYGVKSKFGMTTNGDLFDVYVGEGYLGENMAYRNHLLFYTNLMTEGDLLWIPETEENVFLAEFTRKKKDQTEGMERANGILMKNGRLTTKVIDLTD